MRAACKDLVWILKYLIISYFEEFDIIAIFGAVV